MEDFVEIGGKRYRVTQKVTLPTAEIRGGDAPAKPDDDPFVPPAIKEIYSPTPPTTMAGDPAGLVEAGNIDIMHRPAVRNADGSVSSVRSMSFQDDSGHEILVPTVSEDGRIMADKEAIEQYRKTGKHLGKFDTPESATTYAEALHQQQASLTEPQEVVEIGGKKYRVKGVPRETVDAKTPGQAEFTGAAPGSSERMAAIQKLQAETEATDAARSQAEKGVNVPLIGKVSLPMAGGAIMGALGADTGLPVAAPMAAAGGAALERADQFLRETAGLKDPNDTARIAKEGGLQGAYELGGRAILGSAAKALSPLGNDATRAVLEEAAKYDITPPPGQILAAADSTNPLKPAAGLVYGTGRDIRGMMGTTLGTRAQESVPVTTRAEIEQAGEKLTAGLPPKMEPGPAGIAHEKFVDSLVDEGKSWSNRKYAAATSFAKADPRAVAQPHSMVATARKWQRQLVNAPGQGESQKWLDWTFDNVKGPTHFTKLNLMRQAIGETAFKKTLPGLPGPNTAMLRELYSAAARDMERVPNSVLVDMAKDAREVYKVAVAPFKPGKDKVLSEIVGKSPEQHVTALSGPRGAQYIRELKQVSDVHLNDPGTSSAMRQRITDGLQQIESQTVNNMLDASRKSIPLGRGLMGGAGGSVRLLDGDLLYNNAVKMAPALDAIKGPGYAQEVQKLGRVIAGAQLAPKGAMVRMIAEGGSMSIPAILSHPLSTIPILLGTTAISSLMETPLGVRWLADGILPKKMGAAARGFLSSPLTRVGTADALRYSLTPDERSKVEQSLGPQYQAQVQAVTPGPEGEPPIARIAKDEHPLDGLIAGSAMTSGLSPQFVKAVFTTESHLDPKATSKKGAMGITQMMPSLAQDLGVRDPYDPTESIPAATGHLANLMQRYQGDKAKVLAAYNAGPATVDKYGGVPPFKETQDFVKRVFKREAEFEDQRKAMIESAQKQGDLSWAEVAQRYVKARRSQDPDKWKEIRGIISKRIGKNISDPTLGMSPQEFEKYKPILTEALKPDQGPMGPSLSS